ncbi:MinD-like ATPase involved in chromosome partitioning or flagellar assembly [Paenibacillus sp. 1182]|uniref:AAA family ATPase n=1 Tax=Paenibacillus sp. 1182 TaxID=2806565 RepID=UPI001AE14412|nr:AAA family ATPase [Paenibacillus sp. 1182]MBP1308695.1 MinD-like ATPase involved in chromosome partitioning or flagellar assembly [Paenibacillus sp. 1182]
MSGKVYAIMSVVQGNGAKYVATNLAKSLRRNGKKEMFKKVLLIDFDFENPCLAYEFVKEDDTHGIDNLLAHLNSSGLNESVFSENVIRTSLDVDVLRGTHFIGKVKRFSSLQIESILEVARKLYEVVIVVISPKANNAGTVYTLFEADQVILVLRNNHANLLKVDGVLRVVNQYHKTEHPTLVIYNMKNMLSKVDVNDKLKDSLLDLKVVGVLEYDDQSTDNLDLQKKESIFAAKPINAKVFADIGQQLA